MLPRMKFSILTLSLFYSSWSLAVSINAEKMIPLDSPQSGVGIGYTTEVRNLMQTFDSNIIGCGFIDISAEDFMLGLSEVDEETISTLANFNERLINSRGQCISDLDSIEIQDCNIKGHTAIIHYTIEKYGFYSFNYVPYCLLE